MSHPRQILLRGGPLNGVIHEVRKGWQTPDRFGLPTDDKTLLCWYLTSADKETASFLHTERRDKC